MDVAARWLGVQVMRAAFCVSLAGFGRLWQYIWLGPRFSETRPFMLTLHSLIGCGDAKTAAFKLSA